MNDQLSRFVAQYASKLVLVAVILTVLLIGGVGEVAAHNPAGIEVPACENGADVIAHENPNCHG